MRIKLKATRYAVLDEARDGLNVEVPKELVQKWRLAHKWYWEIENAMVEHYQHAKLEADISKAGVPPMPD